MSIATPKYCLPTETDSVYDPSEDTFLLLDALEVDADLIAGAAPVLCVEIGCGSGLPGAFVAKLLAERQGGKAKCLFLATDINPVAATCTRATLCEHNNDSTFGCDPTICNLLDPFMHRFESIKIDLILFNPPYVPTENEPQIEENSHGAISRAWAGGSDSGVQIVVPLLKKIHKVLSLGGMLYLVALKANNIDKLLNVDTVNLRGSVVLERKAGIEHLFVLKFVRVK